MIRLRMRLPLLTATHRIAWLHDIDTLSEMADC